MLVERQGQGSDLRPIEIPVALFLLVAADARGRVIRPPFPADREIKGLAQDLDGTVRADGCAADTLLVQRRK